MASHPPKVDTRTSGKTNLIDCPVCNREFEKDFIQEHVNKCLFLNTQLEPGISKRGSNFLNSPSPPPQEKRVKLSNNFSTPTMTKSKDPQPQPPRASSRSKEKPPDNIGMNGKRNITGPLAERMRPHNLDELVGQQESFGPGSMLRSMLQQKKVPNMILWGPPGCGKTSLANVIANICREQNTMRFVKMSATMSGINDVKEAVKVAKNEAQYKRQTVLFMDEIHRFNKLQQDTFLPHVESGIITLIGATTENPSFSLNNALLSRCRVVVMEKLAVEDVLLILERALTRSKQALIVDSNGKLEKEFSSDEVPKCLVERASLRWLAEVCDGDARVALGALELAVSAARPADLATGPAALTLEDIKNGIKRSHMLYDRHGEEHYNIVSALHKAVRAGDDNAALYWSTRAMQGGEDPLYVARRLVRAACEDIGLADPSTLVEAMACMHGCQQIGKPECDVLIAQCAVRLARAPKSREVYDAMRRCQRAIAEHKGPLPAVPLHLRNAPTRLMKQIGYGRGYDMRHKDETGLAYMPEGMEDVDFFHTDDDGHG